MALTILDGGVAKKRSEAVYVYTFDYDAESLATDAQLSSVGTFTIDPADGRLTKDSESLVSGNRKVEVRLSGGKPNKMYTIRHTAPTNEAPARTMAAVFHLFIEPA
jgi:hypothetical protein